MNAKSIAAAGLLAITLAVATAGPISTARADEGGSSQPPATVIYQGSTYYYVGPNPNGAGYLYRDDLNNQLIWGN